MGTSAGGGAEENVAGAEAEEMVDETDGVARLVDEGFGATSPEGGYTW